MKREMLFILTFLRYHEVKRSPVHLEKYLDMLKGFRKDVDKMMALYEAGLVSHDLTS